MIRWFSSMKSASVVVARPFGELGGEGEFSMELSTSAPNEAVEKVLAN